MKQDGVLVSGADGYIAGHLIRALKERGTIVRTASRGPDGDLYLDFSRPEQVADLCVDGIGTMIHTVSPHENLYRTDPCRAAAENAAGIHAALDFCVRSRIENFIYFSSFHVFGDREGRLDEETPVSPCDDYGLAHCVAEETVRMYDRGGKLNAWVIRPSNLFGVPTDWEKFTRWNLIPFAFCREAAERGTITLLTPGDQLRNFVGIGDVVRRTLWLLDQKPDRRLLHAYGDETIRVYDYAQRVQAIGSGLLGAPVRICRPEGCTRTADFQFTSRQKDDEILPRDRLDGFIREMMAALMEKRKGRETT